MTMDRSIDTATQSNHLKISTSHCQLLWSVDWNAKIISGSVTHSMIAHTHQSASDAVIVFDSSFLDIRSCSAKADDGTARELTWSLGPRHEVMGSALTVRWQAELAPGDQIEVVIEYATTKKCTTLGWLDSGAYPFLYSQAQAIHARSLVRTSPSPASAAPCSYASRFAAALADSSLGDMIP